MEHQLLAAKKLIQSDISSGLDSIDQLLKSLLPDIVTFKTTKVMSNSLKRLIKLQDSFRYNLMGNLVECLDTFYHQSGIEPETLIQYNRIIQGLLLIHPPSRSIFTSTKNMKSLLQFIEIPSKVDSTIEFHNNHISLVLFEITIGFITSLLHILLKNLDNFRVFETCNGCDIIINKLNLTNVPPKLPNIFNQQDLNFKIIEFLIFYLSDELSIDDIANKKSIKEKSNYFRNYFTDIDSLLESFNDLKTIK